MKPPNHTPRTLFILIGIIALLAGGKAILFDTLDPDCFWHLRVAGQLQSDGIGPLVDQFSHASIKAPWTPYSWLAELAMKWVWDAAGYRAAILSQALMVFALVWVIFLSTNTSQGSSAMSRLFAVVCAVFISMPYLSFRPATLVIFLLAVVQWLIVRDRSLNERSRAVWCIIPLCIIAINVHLFAFLVPIWIACKWLGAMVEKSRISAIRYGKLLIACTLACLCTPMLPGLFQTIFHYQFNDPMVASTIISEMQPFWRGTFGLVALAIVVVFAIITIHQRHWLRPADVSLILISFLLLVQRGRHAPLFAIAMAPIAMRLIPVMSDRILRKPIPAIAAAIVLIAGLIRIALAFPDRNTDLCDWLNRHGDDAPGYPCDAAKYVKSHLPEGDGLLINDFTWGLAGGVLCEAALGRAFAKRA